MVVRDLFSDECAGLLKEAELTKSIIQLLSEANNVAEVLCNTLTLVKTISTAGNARRKYQCIDMTQTECGPFIITASEQLQ